MLSQPAETTAAMRADRCASIATVRSSACTWRWCGFAVTSLHPVRGHRVAVPLAAVGLHGCDHLEDERGDDDEDERDEPHEDEHQRDAHEDADHDDQLEVERLG